MIRNRRWVRWIFIVSGAVFLLMGGYWLFTTTRAQANGQAGWTGGFIAVAGLAFGMAQVVLGALALRRQQPARGVAPTVAAPPATPGMISLTAPEPAAHTRGRDELVGELVRLVRRRYRPAARVRVLHGLGGAGKSTVAQLVARRFADRQGKVWWVSAANATALQTGMRQLVADLGASDHDIQRAWSGLTGAPDLLWTLLSAVPGRWLLVIDNADDTRLLGLDGEPVTAARGWVRPVPNRRGLLLVTTRDGDPELWNTSWCRLHQITMLSASDGAAVLIEHAGKHAGGVREAVALSQRLGGLPLALGLAGRALADAQLLRLPGIPTTFAAYQAAIDPLGESSIGEAVSRTLEMSLDLLDNRGLSEARSLLWLLATFADAPISTGLLGSPLNPRDTQEILRALATLGLITVEHGESDAASLRLHPLIRAATDPVAQLSLAVTLLAGFADGDPDDSGQWPKWQAVAPHAFHLLTQAARTTDTDLIIRAACIAENAARHLNATGLYAVALDHLNALRSIREREQGAHHPDTLTTRYRQAYTTGFAGDPAAARDRFAALLSVQERALGAGHPDTLDTRNQLARWTGETGDIVAARDQYAALLPVHERILGPEHPATLASRQGLAQWTGRAGDSAAARDQFAALLPVRERVLGDEHPDTLATRHRLAQWTGWSGDARAARDLLIGVADSCRRVLGAEHPDCLYAQHDLARWIGYAGDAATARDRFAALLPIREHVLGPEHPETLATRHGFAFWIGAAGDAAAARDLFAALVPVRTRVQGPEHPDTLGSQHELAFWTGKAGDAEDSRAQFAALLPVRERVLGTDHPDTTDTRRKLIEPLDVTTGSTRRWFRSWHRGAGSR
ncbi:tetratricopeptide repeat protein [Micromonospora sp. CA-269861]|uniref:tetratricopeptide repeat protein n=1 Tax=Micromonospora sp. CA-269861 TaxID=3239968 RepID=UPI003D8A6515